MKLLVVVALLSACGSDPELGPDDLRQCDPVFPLDECDALCAAPRNEGTASCEGSNAIGIDDENGGTITQFTCDPLSVVTDSRGEHRGCCISTIDRGEGTTTRFFECE